MYLKINALGDYKKKYDPFARLLALKRGVGVCSVVGVVSGFYGNIREVASTGSTDKLSVGMDRHRVAHLQSHGDATPMTPAWENPGPLHRLEIFLGYYPEYGMCLRCFAGKAGWSCRSVKNARGRFHSFF